MAFWFEDEEHFFWDSAYILRRTLVAEEWLALKSYIKLTDAIMDNKHIFSDDGSKWFITLVEPHFPIFKSKIFVRVEMKMVGPPGRLLKDAKY